MNRIVVCLLLSFSTVTSAYPGPSDVPGAAFGEKSPTRIYLTSLIQAGRPYPVERKIVQVYPYQERCSVQIPYVAGKTLTATFSEGYETYSTPFFANFGRTHGRGPRLSATTGTRGEIISASISNTYEPLDTQEAIKKHMTYLFGEKVERLSLDKKTIPQNMTATILLFEKVEGNAVVLKDMTFNVYAAEVSAENVSFKWERYMKDGKELFRPPQPRFENAKVNVTFSVKGTKLSCPALMSETEINAASLK